MALASITGNDNYPSPHKELYIMRSSRSNRNGWLIGGGIATAITFGILYLFIEVFLDKGSTLWKWFTQVALERWFFPGGLNPVHFTWLFWFMLAFVAGCLAVALWEEVSGYVCAGICAVSVVLWLVVSLFGINDHSGSYAGKTTFIVENTDETPRSLKRLVDDTSPDQNGCALYAFNDMRGCVNKGSFEFEWEARTASATGAELVMRRSSSGVSNTKLLGNTLTYIYGEGDQGVWTAIRDGKSTQPIYGVSSWPGEGNVTTCTFSGQYAMDKAFGGKLGKSLSDEIAGKFPELHYENGDRYGYCDGDKPVVVIPVKEQVAYNTRTTFRSAGVLVITGSPSGDAQYEHILNIKPGDLPGPVYSASLAKEQREAMGMIAGITDSWFGKFGYDETDAVTQSGNASEYQLRDKATGRVYWVTPMKPRGSDDQVLASYAVIPADQANQGSLNDQRIYVLPDGDPRAVNLDDLEARTRQALSETDPGFYPAGGGLAEFLPLSGEEWQVYAELSGRVVYRITVPTDSRIEPTVDKLTSSPTSEEEEGTVDTASACVEDLSKLSDKALAQCLADLAEELNVREGKK